MSSTTLPTFNNIEEAAKRLASVAHQTPVMTSSTLNELTGAQFYFKCENYQRMGAFKFRGAFNALSNLTVEEKTAGVITHSSGNHAQAVALAAKLLGIKATILMPLDAPAAKVAATKGYGGQVIPFDRYKDSRDELIHKLQKETGSVIVPPYDDLYIIAGQGTAAKELIEEVGELDYVFAPLGGGGLLSGTALSTKALLPEAKVFGVEPATGNDGQQSFRTGKIVKIATPKTIADGAQTPSLGNLTFNIIKANVEDILTAQDDELVECMRFFAERMKMVVEPTGCLALAGALTMKEELKGKKIGIIISGGNCDLSRYASFVSTSKL